MPKSKAARLILNLPTENNQKVVNGMETKDEYGQNGPDGGQTQVHPDVVEYVASKMPDMDDLFDVAELFKAFGDLTRARIICALTQSEMCVSDLAVLLEMNQSAVSHQLRMLKQARLVKTRRDGKVRYYSLADEHIQKLFQVAFEHILEE